MNCDGLHKRLRNMLVKELESMLNGDNIHAEMTNGDNRHATIRLAAEKAGVAPCTVSAVLSGRAEQRRVGEKTQRKVVAVARKLGCTPNTLARELRQKQSGVVGVILADFTNNWSDRVITGMEPVFERAGKIPFIAIHRWNPAHDEVGLSRFLQRRVDGIICTPLPENAALYEDLRRRGVPIVFLGDTLEAAPWADFVAWDSPEATRMATRHLLEIGRRKIAMLHQGWRTRIGWTLRAQAFHEELAAAGAAMPAEWRMCVSGDPEVETEIRRVFEGKKAGARV
jgi:Transcriptional regulators